MLHIAGEAAVGALAAVSAAGLANDSSRFALRYSGGFGIVVWIHLKELRVNLLNSSVKDDGGLTRCWDYFPGHFGDTITWHW